MSSNVYYLNVMNVNVEGGGNDLPKNNILHNVDDVLTDSFDHIFTANKKECDVVFIYEQGDDRNDGADAKE